MIVIFLLVHSQNEKELITYRRKHWDDKAVQNMKMIIDGHKCKFQFTWMDFEEGSDFGDLIIISPSKSDKAQSYLIKARFAMHVEEFKDGNFQLFKLD